MLEAVLVHAFWEYVAQTERVAARKRLTSVLGFGYALRHTLPPALISWASGFVSPHLAALMFIGHLIVDSAIGKALVSRLSTSIFALIRMRNLDQLPPPVMALQFGLTSSHEQMSWATLHAVALYVAWRFDGWFW